MDYNVKNPKHYAGDGKITCMDAMKSMTHGLSFDPSVAFWWLTAFKYLWRWPKKGGLKDLEKCKQSIDYLIVARYQQDGATITVSDAVPTMTTNMMDEW